MCVLNIWATLGQEAIVHMQHAPCMRQEHQFLLISQTFCIICAHMYLIGCNSIPFCNQIHHSLTTDGTSSCPPTTKMPQCIIHGSCLLSLLFIIIILLLSVISCLCISKLPLAGNLSLLLGCAIVATCTASWLLPFEHWWQPLVFLCVTSCSSNKVLMSLPLWLFLPPLPLFTAWSHVNAAAILCPLQLTSISFECCIQYFLDVTAMQ